MVVRNRVTQTFHNLSERIRDHYAEAVAIQKLVEEAFDYGEIHVTNGDISKLKECLRILEDVLDSGPTLSQICKYYYYHYI